MNVHVLSSAQSRELDHRAMAEYGVPGIVLMENAGRGVADVLWGLGPVRRAVVCCGRGNNGGDGLVIARHLDLRRAQVEVVIVATAERAAAFDAQRMDVERELRDLNLKGDAATNYAIVRRSGIPLDVISSDVQLRARLDGADWIVDALLGMGSHGEPRPPLDGAIRAINESGVPILAVDLPSGLDADSGRAAKHTIRARHTCTFVAAKPGLVLPAAEQYVGLLHVVDIGAPRRLIDETLQR